MAHLAKPPKKGRPLDPDELRDETARAISESGLTLEAVAAAVLEATPTRKTLGRSAVWNAKEKAGSGVARLQLDILTTLTGARFSDALYRVE